MAKPSVTCPDRLERLTNAPALLPLGLGTALPFAFVIVGPLYGSTFM
jgi:hypothetical protein